MREIGAFEAKTHLSKLLEAAEAGETILITRHGRPVARIGPVEADDAGRRIRALDRLRTIRERIGARLTAEDILSARDEGRR
ncbi:MAG: type II toxin-antitoxin system prevent-host-death family antitoxin [Pseudomonadota bacterium]